VTKNALGSLGLSGLWVFCVPRWGVRYQCAEQRDALKAALDKLGIPGWALTDLGGAKSYFIGIHWAKHNVLLATPVPDSNFQPFVIDAFKMIPFNSPNVIFESVEQFRERYPVPYSGAGL